MMDSSNKCVKGIENILKYKHKFRALKLYTNIQLIKIIQLWEDKDSGIDCVARK